MGRRSPHAAGKTRPSPWMKIPLSQADSFPQGFLVGVFDFKTVGVIEGVSVTVGVSVGMDVRVIVGVNVSVHAGGSVGTSTA